MLGWYPCRGPRSHNHQEKEEEQDREREQAWDPGTPEGVAAAAASGASAEAAVTGDKHTLGEPGGKLHLLTWCPLLP